MISLPPALWSTHWAGVDIAVFAAGDGSPLPVAAAITLLDDTEKVRAARFHFDGDRDRWIRSRAILRLVLANRLGTAPQSLVFNYSQFGKPSLPAFPACQFNLSHSGDFAATACSAEPVGVDIEHWKDDLPALSLAEHVFSPREATDVAGNREPLLHFYRLWTAKEAVMKCTGLGLSLPPSSVAVQFNEGAVCGTATILNADNGGRAAPPVSFALRAHLEPDQWVLTGAREIL